MAEPMSTETTATDTKSTATAHKIPDVPRGFRRIALYKKLWRALPGTHIAGDLLGAQPEEDARGRPYTAIMIHLTAPADVTCFDERGTRNEVAASGEIIAIDASSPCLEKLIALARSSDEYAPTIELHSVEPPAPDNAELDVGDARRFVFFLSETPALRSAVDPVVRAKLAAAQSQLQPNGASAGA
jgi:hypothetical protein